MSSTFRPGQGPERPTIDAAVAAKDQPPAPSGAPGPPARQRQVHVDNPLMALLIGVRIALAGLAANKLRAGLTMLGVLIGVGSVICMVAIGNGAKAESLRRIAMYGANVLFIASGRTRRGVVVGGWGSTQSLTLEDAYALPRQCRLVLRTAPELRQPGQVKWKNVNTTTTVMGTTPDYLAVRNFSIEKGRMFTDAEVRSTARVCVVGKMVQEYVFNNGNPLDKTIRLQGVPFKVIGLMAEKGSLGWSNPDDQITIPITTAMRRLYGRDHVSSIAAQGVSMSALAGAEQEITRVLRKRHRIPRDGEPDFLIRNQAERIEEAENESRMFMMLLAGIAGVSLLVGGIGIMNIMLVSVTERTREIGVRKAVGAKDRDILLQFLIESVVLSVVGGCVGILMGIIASRMFGKVFGWTTVVSLSTVLVAFLFAFVVGVFFGIYPAYKAAALEPVEALRYE